MEKSYKQSLEDKVINRQVPATWVDGYRLYHENDIKKILSDYKEILAANWKAAEQYTPMKPLYPKEDTK